MLFKGLKIKYKLWILTALALMGMFFILAASASSLKPIFYTPSLYWLH
jgi:hypothetical protein